MDFRRLGGDAGKPPICRKMAEQRWSPPGAFSLEVDSWRWVTPRPSGRRNASPRAARRKGRQSTVPARTSVRFRDWAECKSRGTRLRGTGSGRGPGTRGAVVVTAVGTLMVISRRCLSAFSRATAASTASANV